MCKHFTRFFFYFMIILNFFSSSIVQAQVDTLWTKTFGGSDDDYGYSVRQTIDEGYIITGVTSSFGTGLRDVWLIKTDADGDTLWTRTFGGSDEDDGYSVQQTTDEGYIIAGATSSFGTGASDVWLIKTNADGDTIWTRTFGGVGDDVGRSVQQTTDQGYIITGWTSSFGASHGIENVWLIKTNADGDTIWTKTFGDSGSDNGFSVQQTKDDGYIIAGYTSSFTADTFYVWLIKTDTNGDTLWTKRIGGSTLEWGFSVQQTEDEGYIITGETYSFGAGNGDVWLIKTDTNGDTLWTKSFGGSENERGDAVQQTKDKGYIITGNTSSFSAGYKDVWLIKTDSSGDTLWTKTFGGNGVNTGFSVRQTIDEGYIITGETYYSYGTINGNGDVWLIKTTPDVSTIEKTNLNIPFDYKLSQNFPNPFNPKTTFMFSILKSDRVMISIYTISGQIIESKTMNLTPGSYSYEFDGTKYSSGIYFYKISTSSGFTSGRKMVLLK